MMLRALTGFLLILHFDRSTSASTTRCFPLAEGGSACFIQPDPLVYLSWSSAQQWCRSIGATLPIPDTYYHNIVYGNALGYFGLGAETMWLGATSTFYPNSWYWTNGTLFTGTLVNRNITGNTHAYVMRSGTSLNFVASAPFDYGNHVCQGYESELSCGNYYSNSYWTGGKCYLKYRYWVSWYMALSYCGQNQRNLASDNLNELTRWFEDSVRFWIGLRRAWWTWQDTGTGTQSEVIENQFGNNLPNGTSAECLASFKDNSGNILWMNLNCSRSSQFICQQYVTTTTTSTSTTTTTTRPSSTTTTTTPKYSSAGETRTSGTEAANATYLPSIGSENNSINYDLALALGVGIGGGLLLVVIVWLALFTICACKKFREMKYSLMKLQSQTTGNLTTNARNCYDNTTLNVTSETTQGRRVGGPYEALELQRNERPYQRMPDEDQVRVTGGERNTIYANAGQTTY